jgi:CheY-like chemotaxis protein
VLDAARLRASLNAERQKAEVRKRETTAQLTRAERMSSIGMLAEGAANELSQILAPLFNGVDAVDRVAPPLSADALGEIARKASAVLTDLHTIGRSRPGDMQIIRLHDLVDQFLKNRELNQLQQGRPDLRLNVKVSEDLPEIQGAGLPLEQMLLHLVANAMEASTGPRPEVRVAVTCEKVARPVGRYGSSDPGSYVIIRVEDAGTPMSDEDLERLFEPFYVQKRMGRRLISGLGMTLVHRVVEEHRGFLDVVRGFEQGNAICVYLPISARTAPNPALRSTVAGTETILVVDDYGEQRARAAELLASLGYAVLVAANGREALALFEQERAAGRRIDLAVLDLILGDDFDGVSVYKKLLELVPGQKAVIVSGFADLARIVEARQLGIRYVVPKPYALDTLGKAVRAELDS